MIDYQPWTPTNDSTKNWLAQINPFFGSCIWGEQIDFLWFSCILLIKCKRCSEDILFTLFLPHLEFLTIDFSNPAVEENTIGKVLGNIGWVTFEKITFMN